jgi:hypothetical protein
VLTRLAHSKARRIPQLAGDANAGDTEA